MDYDFSRLSTRSFEQLTQAIALAAIGPGVCIFGDGPDGGREATFEGKVAYPSVADPWSGYGVIQAKFRQKPGPKDGDWAVAELKKDLEKFLDKERNLRRPEYYVFVTNVTLTPAAEVGGKDRVHELLKEYSEKIGIKDFRVWDRDQICAFLDIYADIRVSYTAWITPGDVLAEVLTRMAPSRPDFKSVMLNFVRKELISEQYVNLGQAGSITEDKVPLACVFVDVPINGEHMPLKASISSVHKNHASAKLLAPMAGSKAPRAYSAIKNLLYISNQKLDPRSHLQRPSFETAGTSQIPGRVVFIGGPGQGKSTLSQFFCQMHRAALLAQNGNGGMTPEVKSAHELILEQCRIESLSPPLVPRFPVRIELNRFASALAKRETTSLLSYIVALMKRRCDREILSDDLRGWLSSYPWLIALDGLDEVPASSNRTDVLQKIDDFLIDAQECNADLFIIATSRPQGYNDDFAEQYYCHLVLAPLSRQNALHYASRLIARRWGSDVEKTALFSQRINRASEESSTVRLMRSPLQVTIMTLLVESLGEPPKERWRLFNEYYQVINRREKEREIPAAKLLNTYQADIDAIHQEVGKNLQVQSEFSGTTDALLTIEQFSEIIEARLYAEGHSESERIRLGTEILDAALERLVFLVAPQENRVGFEIRSLQEFMAAQALMNGKDEVVVRRLKSIAHASHWRNVFLFAAGRCFYERQHLRDNILAICMNLNEASANLNESRLPSRILAGSQLAIDILEDGAITNQPGQRRVFLRLALRVLELPPNLNHDRVAALYEDCLEDMYKEIILPSIKERGSLKYYNSWHVILELVSKKVAWAEDAADKFWPNDFDLALRIIRSMRESSPSKFIFDKFSQAIAGSSPSDVTVKDIEGLVNKAKLLSVPVPKWIEFLESTCSRRADRLEVTIENIPERFRLIMDRDRSGDVVPKVPVTAHPLWEWFFKCFTLSDNFSLLEFSGIFSSLKDIYPSFHRSAFSEWMWHLPWPIASCLCSLNEYYTLEFYSEQALAGRLGDNRIWAEANIRWSQEQVTLEDLNYCPEEGLPYDFNVNKIGIPLRGRGASIFHVESKDTLSGTLFSLIGSTSNPVNKKALIGKYLFTLTCSGTSSLKTGSRELLDLPANIQAADEAWVQITVLEALPTEAWGMPIIDDVLRSLKGKKYKSANHISEQMCSSVEKYLSANRGSEEALKLMSCCCIQGYKPTVLSSWITPELYEDDESKGYAAVIAVAQGIISHDTANSLYGFMGSAKTDLAKQWRSAMIIEPVISGVVKGGASAVESVLSGLQDQIDLDDLSLKSDIFDAMRDLQRGHLSAPFC
ncbi:NACHT domain-containing NTPase [Pseudomonas sp. FGI182]|uniref:NACHT domain-containing protein n=1 Tax=Pseudomonas sp. FGI182 TaxID=1259844 RepID=UPI0012DF42FA|nr:hypothetical protein [Pseudomonas sp. FGI182]